MTVPRTMFAKIWDDHVITTRGADEALLHVDLNLLHEGSFHSFTELANAGRAIRRPDQTFAVADHYVPTVARERGLAAIKDPEIRGMVEILEANARASGITHFGMDDPRQGIVHVIGPELGLTQPGLTITCPDSHTATHGALGAFAFGIGASQITQVLATQSLWQKKPRTLRIEVDGRIPRGVSGKDIILAIIAKIGIAGARGHVIEYAGSAIRALSMEGRMTVCNMSIEAGGRAGMIAPDDTTFAYLEGRDRAPKGAQWDEAVAAWRELRTDDDAVFDAEVDIDADALTPFVTWGTNPGQGLPLGERVPDPAQIVDENERVTAEKALTYMGLEAGTPLRDIHVDTVFVGSCTNGRIEDLRSVADIMDGRTVAAGVRMLVVPGSMRVRFQAEQEGLDKIFTAAGAEWRSAGCSMCLGMNPDQLAPGERSASTSNRNFEGRQGKGGRTHLVSPLVAAATAVRGTLSSPEDLN